jgi:MOSC domain-containing protein YiiM
MGAVMVQTGTVMAVNISVKRGEKKHDVGEAYLQEGMGITTDAHRGEWHRQVSLLSLSSVEKMRQLGLDIQYGDFAENLTVSGLEVYTLPIGTRLKIGEALAEVTQIGKACHNQGCAIKKQAGHCVMPLEGIFVKVLESGWVRRGDKVQVL